MAKPAFKLPTGTNFRTADEVPVSLLSKCLCGVASFLQPIVGPAPLIRFDDWLEHDGLHFERSRIDMHALFQIVGTAQSVYEATPSDEYVCVGIAPLDCDWYLRFRANWDDAGDSLVGRFDVTLPPGLAVSFRDDVVAALECEITEEPASAYYQRIVL